MDRRSSSWARWARESGLFLVILLLNGLLFLFLVMDDRVVRGHDTLMLYMLRHTFLSNVHATGEIPLWMPFMSQGSVSSWVFGAQASVAQGVTLLFGQWLPDNSFPTLFMLQFLFDETLLLVGLWRLGRRYYSSGQARFFVAVAGVGSCLWTEQPYFNLYAYYSLPLILALLHEALDEHSRVKLFLAANLVHLQLATGPAYLVVFVFFVIVLYAGCALLVRPGASLAAWRGFGPRWSDIFWVAAIGASLWVFYVLVAGDTADVVFASFYGRLPSGATQIDLFLTYGGRTDPFRWADILVGLSPNLDFSLYCGMLTLAFAALALFCAPDRTTVRLFLCAALLFLFSVGPWSVVAMLGYYLVPWMAYYRHVCLAAPTVKLFIILLAGKGLETALKSRCSIQGPAKLIGLGLSALCLALGALSGLFWRGHDWAAEPFRALAKIDHAISLFPGSYTAPIFCGLVSSAACSAGLAGLTLLTLGFSRRAVPAVCILVMVLHPLDLYGWKFRHLFNRTARAPAEFLEKQTLSKLPYPPRRTLETTGSSRHVGMPSSTLHLGSYLAWFADAYFQLDRPWGAYRIDYWMRPLDEFLRYMQLPGARYVGSLADPRAVVADWHKASHKLVGLTEDKLQVFSTAYRVKDAQGVGPLISHPAFEGNLLFVTAGTGGDPPPPARDWRFQSAPNGNARLQARCDVRRFDANNLTLVVDVPGGASQPWLYYSSVWDRHWRARVNGRPVTIYRANLAHQAIPLEPGKNAVELGYSSPGRSLALAVWYAVCLGWFLGVLWQVLVMVFGSNWAGPGAVAGPALRWLLTGEVDDDAGGPGSTRAGGTAPDEG
ncbi:MAG: hypothetical protein HY815_03665 [Candidatus Riflebacteria bacterium]|nr:hypothetical protein [Candidatus Riflebacteria bacterium]